MAYFPPIPARFYCIGDRDKAVKLIPIARALLGDVNNAMKFSALPTGHKNREYADGTMIEAVIQYGLSTATIHVPLIKKAAPKEELVRACWCFPCLSFCIIEKVYLAGIVQDETAVESETIDNLEAGYRYYYDVSVCQNGAFVLLEGFNVKSSGFGLHPVGQYCLLTIDNGITSGSPGDVIPMPNCCSSPLCLVGDLDNEDKLLKMFLSVIPVHVLEDMTK